MKDPHEVFGLPAGADEAAVRKRYLELVRRFPPERSPDRFAEIHAAYDELRDPRRRLEKQIFGLRDGESLGDIISDVRDRLCGARIPVDTLLSLADD